MHIAGICRFSLVGPGDWRAYRGASKDQHEAIAAKQVASLFAPARVEQRLETFEHITLASMKAQSDQDFHFLVLASELMPEIYRDRLSRICAGVPQVSLRFFPVTGAGAAQMQVMSDLGLSYRQTLQFRLDDDDALSANYVGKMRTYCTPLARSRMQFSASFHRVAFVNTADGTGFAKDLPFMSAGTAVLHHRRTIFAFGHFGLRKRFPAVSVPSCHSLILKHDTNDSTVERPPPRSRMTVQKMREYLDQNYPFLDGEGLRLLGHA